MTKEQIIDHMVEKFLAWPLPGSVCSDLCVTKQNVPHRSGTNLLSAIEAKQMFEHVCEDIWQQREVWERQADLAADLNEGLTKINSDLNRELVAAREEGEQWHQATTVSQDELFKMNKELTTVREERDRFAAAVTHKAEFRTLFGAGFRAMELYRKQLDKAHDEVADLRGAVDAAIAWFEHKPCLGPYDTLLKLRQSRGIMP